MGKEVVKGEDTRTEQAREILQNAVPDAATVLVNEMYGGKNSSDRIRAAERILEEGGVIGREQPQGEGMASADVIKLIEVVGKMFGVQAEDVQGARERNVTPELRPAISDAALRKMEEDR